jgi:brefeldin A-resistance guanine nucleotide exchange factor 1
MRVPVVLHGISSFDQDILETSATPILKGLSRCISSSGPLRSEIIVSPDFWSILQRLHTQESSAPLVFELLQRIVDSTPPISADNYESAVSLANEFASTGSVGAVEERKRDAQLRRSRGSKAEKPTYVNYLLCFIAHETNKTSENQTVTRGIKAIGIIYQMTARIPSLIQQSHLEKNEGE